MKDREVCLRGPVALPITFGFGLWLAFTIPCRSDEQRALPSTPQPIRAPQLIRSAPFGLYSYQRTAFQGSSPLSDAAQTKLAKRHRFWDARNAVLFSLVGASRGLDYSSTLNMRRRGRDEILLSNDIVDNHPAFAAIEAGGTAVSIGASYLFHRYHHHRLERWTSIIHASLTTTGAVRNYCLKTAHPSTMP